MPAALLRQLDQEDVTCPAGEQVRDADVVCRVLDDLIEGHLSPASIEGFCAGSYTTCPVWRSHKEALRAHRRLELADGPDRVNGGGNLLAPR